MANTSSAKKAVRKIARRTLVNRSRRSQMRTQIRKADEALAGEAAAARPVVKATESAIMRAAQKGILHKNTAARKISRLARKMKHLAEGATA